MEEEICKKNIIKEEEKIEVNEYINEEGERIKERTIIKKIYIKETKNEIEKDSQKRYYEKNKEKVNDYIKRYSNERYKTDHEYREKIKQKRREDYAKKKELKKN